MKKSVAKEDVAKDDTQSMVSGWCIDKQKLFYNVI